MAMVCSAVPTDVAAPTLGHRCFPRSSWAPLLRPRTRASARTRPAFKTGARERGLGGGGAKGGLGGSAAAAHRVCDGAGALFCCRPPLSPLTQHPRLPTLASMGLLFFVLMNQVFGQMGSMSVFIEERLIFSRERAAGFYTALPYFIVRVPVCFMALVCVLLPPVLRCSQSGDSRVSGQNVHRSTHAVLLSPTPDVHHLLGVWPAGKPASRGGVGRRRRRPGTRSFLSPLSRALQPTLSFSTSPSAS